jgi:hypothetical protein
MILRAMLEVAYATGRASLAGQVKGDDPDKKGYLGPPGWGFGVGLTVPHSKKKIIFAPVADRPKHTAGCSANRRKEELCSEGESLLRRDAL